MPPPKLRRRPALVAGAIVAICLGAILAAWAWTSTTHTQEVLAARTTIERGSVIGAADLQRVQINADPALQPLPASAYQDVVGKRAALDIAAGGLLTAEATTSSALPPAGMSVVGIALTPAQVPALRLQSGDRVRIVV
ncbi:MAG TPA: SAF domain-containing protein, partial [Marmoricola sp.]